MQSDPLLKAVDQEIAKRPGPGKHDFGDPVGFKHHSDQVVIRRHRGSGARYVDCKRCRRSLIHLRGADEVIGTATISGCV